MATPLPAGELDRLFELSTGAILGAFRGRAPDLPPLGALPPALRRPGGAFVTLTVRGELNGCIGSIGGDEPLGLVVPRLALQAAFADPRLPALQPEDLPDTEIELSLLSDLVPLAAGCRAELIAGLRPGIDGLVVSADGRRGVFLPDVWQTLPEPDEFLDQLWLKAGLEPGTWAADLRLWRFTTEHHERPVLQPAAA